MTDRSEHTRVRCWRNMGMGWAGVAKALGKSIDYTRSVHDAGYRKANAPKAAEALPIRFSPGRQAAETTSKTARFVAALYAAKRPVMRADLDFDPKFVVKTLRRRFGREAIAGVGDGWSLSNEGRRVAREVYGVGR